MTVWDIVKKIRGGTPPRQAIGEEISSPTPPQSRGRDTGGGGGGGSPASQAQLAHAKDEKVEVETTELGEEEKEETKKEVRLPPGPPERSDRGNVVIPQRPVQPGDTTYLASQTGDIELQRGRIDYPTPLERAKTQAEERVEQERMEFEETYQPQAQDIIRTRYQEIMAERMESLGMVYDPVSNTYYYTRPIPNQEEVLEAYRIDAMQQAMQEGQEYIETQWEQEYMEERIGSIYKKEYYEEDYKLLEQDDGTFQVIPMSQYKKMQRVESEKEDIKARMSGSITDRLLEGVRFTSLSVLKPASMLGPYISYSLEGSFDKAIELYAEKVVGLENKNILQVAASSYTDPGGLGFIGTGAALFTWVFGPTGLGALTGSTVVRKGVPAAIMVGAGGFAAKDVYDTLQTQGESEARAKSASYIMGFGLAAGFGYAATRGPINLMPKRGVEAYARIGKTGDITALGARKYIDVFGRKIHYGPRGFTDLRGMGNYGPRPMFDMYGRPVTPTPKGLAQTPYWKPTKVQPGLAVSGWDTGKGIIVNIGTGTGWQMKTGLPLPGVYTKGQPILRGLRPIKEITPKPIVEYDPVMNKIVNLKESDIINQKFLARGAEWQPKTGIPDLPVRDSTGRVKPYTPQEKNFTEKRLFKPKPLKDVVTRIDASDKGVLSVEKYGRKIIQVGKDKSITGLPLPGVYTKGQPILRGLRPLVKVKKTPRGLIPIEETTPDVTTLESGLAKKYEGIIKIKPVVKKTKWHSFKDIVKPEKPSTLDIVIGRGQKTIQIMKEPKTMKKQELKLKSLQSKKELVDVKKFKPIVTEKSYLETMTQMKQPSITTEKKTGMQSKYDTKQIFGVISLQDQMEKQMIGSVQAQRYYPKYETAEIQKTRFAPVVVFVSKVESAYDRLSKTVFETPKVIQNIYQPDAIVEKPKPKKPKEITTTEAKKKLLKGFDGKLNKIFVEEPVYRVEVKRRQFVNGRRIRGTEWTPINNKVYRESDAKAMGSHVVDNNAKRTFRLKEAEGKPSRKPKNVRSWGLQQLEYIDKGNNKYVEINRHAIDSPGEIREITMKGIQARKRGGRQSKNGVTRDIERFNTKGIENRMMRRVII